MERFLSTFANKIDRKGRVSVPADFRAVLSKRGAQAVVLYPSIHVEAIEGAGEDYLDQLSKRIESLPPLSAERDDLIDAIMPAIRRLPFDSEGRIMLPDNLIARARLTDTALFVGRFDNFQIWDPETWRKRQAQALTRARAMRDGGRK